MLLKKAICFTMAMAIASTSVYAAQNAISLFPQQNVVSQAPVAVNNEHLSIAKSSGGQQKVMSSYFSNFGKIVTSYMYVNDDNTFCVFDVSNNIINVDTYNSQTYELIGSKTIDMELPLFGGFYCGSKYNFIVFGQSNPNEYDNTVTFKTVKYSKQWEKLGDAEYRKNNTVQPFEAGSLRMTEYNDYLYVRSAHKMYKSKDGLNHQANITYSVDIQKMDITDEYSRVMNSDYGYVSHSFDQYIAMDNDKLVALDLGDAYPRSVVLIKYNDSLKNGKFTASNGNCSVVDMLKIPGMTGDNYTGVTIGGFEVSKNNYIAAVSSVDQKTKSSVRDVMLLITNKKDNSTVKQICITDYVKNGKGATASKPYIVKLPDENYMLLWEEFSEGVSQGVRCVKVDENGKMLTNIVSVADVKLSSDCQPICIGDKIVWYVNNGMERTFYKI